MTRSSLLPTGTAGAVAPCRAPGLRVPLRTAGALLAVALLTSACDRSAPVPPAGAPAPADGQRASGGAAEAGTPGDSAGRAAPGHGGGDSTSLPPAPDRMATNGGPADSTGAPRRATPPGVLPPPVPPGARVPRPDSVRALYVNAWAAGSRPRMAELIRIADATEVNALIIDIKESDTYLTYAGTAIPLAREIGADQRPASTWLPALVDTLRAHGIHAIARIVVFKDRELAERKPELAIRDTSGALWRDRKGIAWVNPYDRRVWDYNIAIAREALAMGFGEVQWDYVRFPDVTSTMRATMAYPGSGGRSRAENIRDFLRYSREQLADFAVPITADVFGLSTHVAGDVEIGQHWETVVGTADVVLPMVYPSHYAPGLYGFARPLAHPYEIVRLALTDAAERTRWVRDSSGRRTGQVMAWLEAMSIRGAQYGAAEVRAQIQAAYDAGVPSWALWNPGSRFGAFEDALRPASGGPSPVEARGWRAPEWTLPRERLSPVIRKRDAAARAAAARAATPPPAASPPPSRRPSGAS